MSNYTRYNATQIQANARSFSHYRVGQCLNYVWVCSDAPRSANINDANAAWYAATQKETVGNPPAGAPVYWSGGRYGHIAISLGNGYVRSTDYPNKGQVGTVAIYLITRQWGLNYRGWSRSYANHPIDGIQKGTSAPPAAPVLRRGMVSNAVYKLQQDLMRVFPAYRTILAAAGAPVTTFGAATETVVKMFQENNSLPQTGVVDARTWTVLAQRGIRP